MSGNELSNNRRLLNGLAQPNAALRNSTGKLPTLAEIADERYLIAVFDDLARTGGQAPGPDRLRYGSFARSERARVLTWVARLIRQGRYLPGPTRAVSIRKPDGAWRTLRLSNVVDRVVATALHYQLSPWWEQWFSPASHGFRPGRGVHTLLASMEVAMVRTNRWVLVVDDIRRAFEHPRIAGVMAAHALRISDAVLLSFIEDVLRGHQGSRRCIGIDQGSAYSPTAMNAILDDVLDQPLHRLQLFHLRYADNIILLARNMTEGRDVHGETRRLLAQTGLQLKGGDAHCITDLRSGGNVRLLGLSIHKVGDTIVYRTDDTAWADLDMHIRDAHTRVDPADTARAVIRGWISAQGPALANWGIAELDRLHAITDRHGLPCMGREEFDMLRQDVHARHGLLMQDAERHDRTG